MKRWIVLFGVLMLGCSRGNQAPQTPKPVAQWSPPASIEMLGQPLDRLLQAKPGGQKDYGTNAAGKTLSDVRYDERWFGLEKPVSTVYYLGTEAPFKVNQLTLNFPETEKFYKIAKQVTQCLGQPVRQGKSAPDSPSRYDATWKTNGLLFTLVDLEGPLELSIMPVPSDAR